MQALRRGLGGVALILLLGSGYLALAGLAKIAPRSATRLRHGLDRRGARMLAAHCRRHGALLIKLAQWIASRPDLVPLPYVDACAPLRDQAPARPWAAVRRQLERAYEGRIDTHLRELEQTPIASASFGQVHRARTPDGTPVAVKVQHEGLAPLVEMDLRVLRLALWMLKPLAPGWPLDLVYQELARTSREEQDYLIEGRAAERLRPVVAKHGIGVPRVFWEHTRDTVLVTEFVPGATLAQTNLRALPLAIRERIANEIVDGYLAQLLDEGFFHGDPHGGNLIWDGAKLWLIDFGMTDTLGDRDRIAYRRFLLCLRGDDTDGMVDVLVGLGVLTPGADAQGMKDVAREIYAELKDISLTSFKGSKREGELSQQVGAFLRRLKGLVLPRHTILLVRALSLVEGICLELLPDRNMLMIVRPKLGRLVSPWQLLRDRWTRLQEDAQRFLALPDRVEALLQPRREAVPVPTVALLAAVLLLAALQLPEGTARVVAVVATALGVLFSLFRR